jgi:hypothetical protein
VSEPVPRRGSDAAGSAEYSERLRTPWWWYPIGIVVGVLLGAEFDFVMPQALVGLPILLAVLVAIVMVWRLSASTVSVSGGRVLARAKSLPVAEIEQSHRLSPAELRRLVGRHGDPLGYVFIRPWIGPGVQLVLSPPPDDPDAAARERLREPYWVLSSRHPDRLLAAIEAARSQDPAAR